MQDGAKPKMEIVAAVKLNPIPLKTDEEEAVALRTVFYNGFCSKISKKRRFLKMKISTCN
jgi:hypothetical protein